jgi:hypothetical protein
LAQVVVLPAPFELEWGGFISEQLDQRIVENFDDLLSGRNRLQDFLAHRPVLHRIDECLGDGQIDISFEQCQANFPQRLRNIRFADPAKSAQFLEYAVETIAELREHGSLFVIGYS